MRKEIQRGAFFFGGRERKFLLLTDFQSIYQPQEGK